MNTNLLKNSLLVTIVALGMSANAQNNLSQFTGKKVSSVIENKQISVSGVKTKAIKSLVTKSVTAAPTVNYDLPDYRPVGGEFPKAHYVSYNRIINDKKTMMLLAKDTLVTFYDLSTNSPTSWLWEAPGGVADAFNTQDLTVKYPVKGLVDCPSLTVSNADGSAGPAAYEAKLNVGGKAEIVPFNGLNLNETYGLWMGQFQSGEFAFGTNNNEIPKLANLQVFAQDKVKIEGVSVYIAANPTCVDPNQKVKLGIYYPGFDANNDFDPTAIEVAVAELKVSEMMAEASSVTGIKYTDGTEAMGLAQFMFDEPVVIDGGLATFCLFDMPQDLAAGDEFAVWADDKAVVLDFNTALILEVTTWLYAMTTGGDYAWLPGQQIMPDGSNVILHMAPIVNFDTEASAIEDANADMASNKAYVSGNNIVLEYANAVAAEVYNTMGQKTAEVVLNGNGTNEISVNGNGVYIVKFISEKGAANTVKVIK